MPWGELKKGRVAGVAFQVRAARSSRWGPRFHSPSWLVARGRANSLLDERIEVLGPVPNASRGDSNEVRPLTRSAPLLH